MSAMLQHRGYYGSIKVSPEDNCLFGKLQFIRALVSYEGETVAELTQAFCDVVDDYLDDCASLGRESEIPRKGPFSVRAVHDLGPAASVAAGDLDLAQVVKARIDANETSIRVSLDDLIGEAEADIVNER